MLEAVNRRSSWWSASFDDLVPVSDYIDTVRSEQIALGRLLTVLSLLTILLSAVGLYGVVSYDVTSRRRELTIRSAVGARGSHMAGIVARYAGAAVLIGGAFGVLGAFALSQVLESRLFGVAAVDPLSYLGGIVVLVFASALSCVAPTVVAWRADPATVLRHD
jgi:ABC-type antimicrobial peptide transport system permease subunit